MTMPRITRAFGAILISLCGLNADALQLGQLSAQSRLGENLSARIEVYGLDSAVSNQPEFTVKPEIGQGSNAAAKNLVEQIEFELINQAGYRPYIAVSTNVAVNEPALKFRVRTKHGAEISIKHFSVALLPEAYARRSQARRAGAQDLADASSRAPAGNDVERPADVQTYGPVRSGQSLYRILRELDLHRGNTAALIERIVNLNPQAFSNGNADRLRVGVMLQIPGAARATVSTTSPASPEVALEPITTNPAPVTTVAKTATPATARAFQDPQTTARLAALAEKFATIKARYASQNAAVQNVADAAVENPSTLTAANGDTARASGEIADGTTAAAGGTMTNLDADGVNESAGSETAAPTTAPAESSSSAPASTLWTNVLIGVTALLLLIAVVSLAAYAMRRWRAGRQHNAARAVDLAMVEEIARKAEQRLKLEDEVKRRISANRNAKVEQPASTNSIERSMDKASESELASLEEIENRIAHGQYKEAEEMLNQVIAKTPNNSRAKLRLAEIYYLNERTDEFVELAADIAAKHRDDIGDDGWQRIMRMGKVIAPERPPFSGPVSVESSA